MLPKQRQLSRFWNQSSFQTLVQLRKVQVLSTIAQFWQYSVPESPEGGSPVDESFHFSSHESLQFKLKTIACLGERSEDSQETLLSNTEAAVFQESAEDSKKQLREEPKSMSRNNWRLQWRALPLSQRISLGVATN